MSHASPLIERDIHAYLKQHEEKELLRFITCGSVDDGKSTLIGRLLHDSSLVYEDQLAAVTRDSERFGTTGDAPDLALLVDGLQAEREQGITIDVAYRYFSTAKRKFIIADTPGHEQYTRNMATGASTASLATILVDASKGVSTQTKRHTTIVSLLGIRRIVVAVNKMDLVDFEEGAFEKVRDDYRAFLASLGHQAEVHFVPMSALQGDNVVHGSERTPWYPGGSLMEILETVDVREERNLTDLRFPVQYVNRPDAHFRGYAGTLASGAVRVGDEVMVLPSRRHGRVESIKTFDGDLEEARAPQAVTLTLEEDLDVGRGDLLAHPGNAPSVSDALDATVVWMSDAPLKPGKLFELHLGTATTPALVRAVHHGIDVDTGTQVEATALGLNEIGSCRLTLTHALAFDPYATLPATGSFVLVDRVSNATVGAGMIERPAPRPERADKATNVTWHETRVTKATRAEQKGQKPCVLWFTGLSGAGKSTIANALEQRLVSMGHHTYLLDGDNVRHGLNRDLGFGDDDRVENIRRIGEVAKLLDDAGLIVLTAFISPFRSDRRLVREMFADGEFLEVFVDTPLDVAEERDPKGLYARARRGEIENFTGIDSPYERPSEPEVHLDADGKSVEALVDEVVDYLLRAGIA